MKILMFGWEFPPHISGGLGTACYGITRGLTANDVNLLFVVPKVYGDESPGKFRLIPADQVSLSGLPEEISRMKDKLTYIEVPSVIAPYIAPEDFFRIDKSSVEEKKINQSHPYSAPFNFSGKYGKDLIQEVWQYAMVAGEIADKNRFDIIHAHDWLSFPAGIMAKEQSDKPLVIHVHATEFDRSGENYNPQVFDIEKRGMEAADKIIAVSDFTRNIIIDRYHIKPGKVVTVHNAVDKPETEIIKSHDLPFKEKIVSYLGRVTFQKGPEYFVEAALKVLKNDKNVRFVMAGSGDMYYRMIRKVAGHRISSHFHFTGFLNRDSVNKIFAMSDVYVMPSVSEPFGISPLEAIRSGVPVIISKQSGVNEVLKHAIKINFWDTDAMADAIYALTSFKGLSELFVREGKKDIESLKWENQAKQIKNIYQEIITSKS